MEGMESKNSVLCKRPNSSDTEENLLEMQAEFIAQSKIKRIEPSAQLIRIKKDKIELDKPSQMDNVNLIRSVKKDIAVGRESNTLSSCVIGNIAEKYNDTIPFMSNESAKSGFPKSFKLNVSKPLPGKSMFATHFAQRASNSKEIINTSKSNFTFSNVITGEGLGDKKSYDAIHLQNESILNSMEEGELNEARQNILDNISSDKVNFLRNFSARKKTTESSNYVPINVEKQWLNMDVVEPEKLSYFKELPKFPDAPAHRELRFDFSGARVLDINMPVIKGLHHHGKEPEIPGYTIQELIQFCFSSVLQQRSIGLHTILAIFNRVLSGSESFEILSYIADSHIALVLRMLLDEQIPQVVTLSIFNLSKLLYSEEEMEYVRLHILHSKNIKVFTSIPKCTDADKLDERELILKDIVAGLLRTNIQHRLSYILEKIELSPEAVVECLNITCAMCQHSTEAADAFSRTPNLLKLVTKLMEYNVDAVRMAAISTLRVLSLMGKTIAERILMFTDVNKRILTAIGDDLTDICFRIECLLLATVLLSYKLCFDTVGSIFEEIIKKVILLQRIVLQDEENSSVEYLYSCALLRCISAFASCFSAETPPENWYYLEQLFGLIESALVNWLLQMKNISSLNIQQLRLLSCAIDTIAVIYNNFHQNKNYDPTRLVDKSSRFCTKLLPILKSNIFINMHCNTPNFTSSLRNFEARYKVFMISFAQKNLNMLTNSVLDVFSILSLVNKSFLKLDGAEICYFCLDVVDSLVYMPDYSRIPLEIYVSALKLLLNFASSQFELSCNQYKKLYCAIFIAIGILPLTFSDFVAYLLKKWLFNDILLSNVIQSDDVTKQFSHLFITDIARIHSPEQFYKQSFQFLSEKISDMFNSVFEFSETLASSRLMIMTKCHFFEPMGYEWPYILFSKMCYTKDHDITLILKVIHWLTQLEHSIPLYSKKCNMLVKITHLALIYLKGAKLYLNDDVKSSLLFALRSILANATPNQFLLEDKFRINLLRFTDFVQMLLDEFIAESYGDHLFANVLLLHAVPENSELLELMFTDKCGLIQLMRMPVSELIFPFDWLSKSSKPNENLLRAQFSLIQERTLNSDRCPVLFNLAVHHLKDFYNNDSSPVLFGVSRTVFQKIVFPE